MHTVSIQSLKTNFAFWAAKAAAGETVQVTRHNREFVRLSGCQAEGVHVGSRVGIEPLKSALQGPTRGKWRKILDDDRNGAR